MMRAKFKVDSITRVKYQDGEMQTIKMSPVTSGSEENKQFWKWTPCGSLELGTVNAEAVKQFDLGTEVYLDFTPAPAPEKK